MRYLLRTLHLSVKAVYFREMQAGSKQFEFRLKTEYWRKRLENREYDEVKIKLGYPKSSEQERILIRPWRGYEEQTISHPHFGDYPVQVFAIRVN